MKQKIMEALLDSNHNLTKEEIMWAASHLPNNNDKGSHSPIASFKFNHDADDLTEAIGFDKQDIDASIKILSDTTKKLIFQEDYKISHAVEEVMQKTEDIKGFFPVLLAKVMRDATSKLENVMEGRGSVASGPDVKALLELLQRMSKRKDNDEE